VERAIVQDRRVAHALGLALAAAVAWQLVSFSPIQAAVGVGALALAVYSFARPRQVLWGLLVLKPLVDLTWAMPVVSLGSADYNVQTVQGGFVAALGLLHVAASWKRPRVDSWPLAALVAVMGLSTLLRPGMLQLASLARLVSGVLFFAFAGVYFTDARGVRRLAAGILAATGAIVLVGYLQVAGLVPYTWHIDWATLHLARVSGGYEHPGDLARLLLVTHPLALMLLWQSRTWHGRAVYLVFLGAAYGVLILSYHRMGWCVVLMELLMWLGLKRRVGTAVLVAAGVIGAVLIHWTFLAELFRTLLFVFQSNTDLAMADFLSGRGHMFLDQGYLTHWLRSGPLVHAFGFGTPRLEIQGIVYDQTDCDYLRVLVSYGVVGLVLYAATLVWCLWQGIGLMREARAVREPFWQDVGVVTVVLTPAVALFAVTTYSLNYPILVWIFFAIVSIAVAARHRLQEAAARKVAAAAHVSA